MKRFMNYFLAAVLCFSSLPVALLTNAPETVYANSHWIASSEKNLKREIYKSLANFETSFSINHVGDVNNLKTQLNSIMDEFRKTKSYVYENISKWEASYRHVGNTATIHFTITYLTSKEQEDYVSAQAKKLLPTIVSASASDFEKVKAVHDYIIVNSSYSSNTLNSQYITYTLLTENEGVCQAYALLMYKMLEELNVEVKYVKGHAGGERHAWVLAKVEGAWYHVDVTWDDPVPNRENEVRYKYFLLSDSQMATTHSWSNAEYPPATKENFAYLQVVDSAFTKGQTLYYKNIKDSEFYQMDLKTLKISKITASVYNQEKKSLSSQ
ncbi:transglutaminase domain-containing protein [Solibacillus sp. FSL H8-0538]|uniref:transglutaminase domain-containing protein n=1 Tax=Solibacillus sp. FSL H8-0538 TaxID=2921400 RepID=UPI0030FB193C